MTIKTVKAKRKRSVQKTRIYYGPPGKEKSLFWTVRVKDATKDAVVNGKLIHALMAHRGLTVGCAMSNVSRDNPNAFNHPVLLAVFYKTTALFITKIVKGKPSDAVRYAHSYGRYVTMNDTGELKEAAKIDPSLMEREFTLRRPPPPRRVIGTFKDHPGKKHYDSKLGILHQGALARAVKAGLILQPVAEQLTQLVK